MALFKKKEPKPKDTFNMEELLAAEAELKYLREKYGIETPEKEKEGKISRMISNFFERRDMRQKVLVNRKKFLWLLLFTGWAGGHRFYARHYKVAIFYLLTCWSGMSIAMSIIDFLQFVPYPVDENGNIMV